MKLPMLGDVINGCANHLILTCLDQAEEGKTFPNQYVTRDTFGFAMKATYGIINGHPVEIFKDPKTDDGVKKSARGLLKVNSDFTLSERVTEKEENEGLLETVFLDGKLIKETSLKEIRAKLL